MPAALVSFTTGLTGPGFSATQLLLRVQTKEGPERVEMKCVEGGAGLYGALTRDATQRNATMGEDALSFSPLSQLRGSGRLRFSFLPSALGSTRGSGCG